MHSLGQQLLLQHSNLQSVVDLAMLYGQDEVGSERAMVLLNDFANQMRRHIEGESRQLSQRTLNLKSALAFDRHIQKTRAQLADLIEDATTHATEPLSSFHHRLVTLLEEHLVQEAHRKLINSL